uniref:TGF-beta family profile domain-containing protein n=1 Tax=Eptatretus burgeri TaxID=7764 RepID=A0A8C4RC80_EPTBU
MVTYRALGASSLCILLCFLPCHMDALPSSEHKGVALRQLLAVLGLAEHPPAENPPTEQPPQYMLDLYHAVADAEGVTRAPGLLEGNVVRSFLEKGNSPPRFQFDVSAVPLTERIITAEFHVFRAHIPPASNARNGYTHFGKLNIYQVKDILGGNVRNERKSETLTRARLISSRRVSIYKSGWEVFSVTQAVRRWIDNYDNNQGLMATIQLVGPSDTTELGILDFVPSGTLSSSRRPMLVVFTDDGRRSLLTLSLKKEPHLHGIPGILQQEIPNEQTVNPLNLYPQTINMKAFIPYQVQPFESLPTTLPVPKSLRHLRKRSLSKDLVAASDTSVVVQKHDNPLPNDGPLAACSRRPLYVDFEEAGWAGWIISPRGYQAYQCAGACPFPLGGSARPTNHASVRAVLQALRPGRAVSPPCCVPDQLNSINLLYYDSEGNVVLRRYNDMVAVSCGCH